MILLVVAWALYSVSEAYEDHSYTVILDHKPTVYPRLCIGMIVLLLHRHELDTWQMLSLALILTSVFWLIFELAKNIFDGHYIGYMGTVSSWDRKLKPYEGIVLFVRFFLVCLSFALY